MADFTQREKRECALRELEFRRKVYPGLIQKRRMRRPDAEREIALMQEIADDYREPGLFSGKDDRWANRPDPRAYPNLPADERDGGTPKPPKPERGSR